MKLPVIDFSNLKQHEANPTSLKSQQVFKALEEYGCFEARFDQIPHNPVFDGLPQLFDLPLETKLRNKAKLPYYNGYIAKSPSLPLYESFGISDILYPGKIDTFTNLMWSQQGNPTFSTSVQSFYDGSSEIDKMARRMVVERLGLEKYMDEHMNSTEYLIRLMKYDGPQTHEAKLGLLPHRDKNILTILSENGVGELRVQTKGGDWITAETSLGSFIVITGESFHAWTNGRVHCANHSVMMRGVEARYSVALFSFPKPGYIVKAPEEIVDDEHPLLYKPFKYNEFLHFQRSEAGQSSGPYPLKVYCGV